MKLLIWKNIFLIGISFLLGLGVMYFHINTIIKQHNAITVRIIDNCSESIADSQKIINSSNEAYTEVTTCFNNLYTCNLPKSKQKLQALNEQKNTAYARLEKATNDLANIVGEAKK